MRHDASGLARPARGWRWAGYAALTAVLALAFYGYMRPDLVVSWETLMALCGFG